MRYFMIVLMIVSMCGCSKEAKEYKKAAAGGIEAIEEYIKTNPVGKYYRKARRQLMKMKFEATCEVDTPEVWARFILEFPGSSYMDEIENEIFPRFKEEAASIDNMILIPAGEFMMGKDKYNKGHPVELDSFYIDKHELTNLEYLKFWLAKGMMESEVTPESYGSRYGLKKWPNIALEKPDHPVVGVTWRQALEYTVWANKRLLTEAEWEFAARGTDNLLLPWGNDFNQEINSITVHANVYDSEDGYEFAAPVMSFPTGVSPFGVFDMAGNVCEWCHDRYGDLPETRVKNPKGATGEIRRVFRGGSWDETSEVAESMVRWFGTPDAKRYDVGFRCAGDVTVEESQ